MHATHKRSFLKAISYRILGYIMTALLVYFATKNVMLSLGIGAIDSFIKIIGYYFHERIWDKIEWGRK